MSGKETLVVPMSHKVWWDTLNFNLSATKWIVTLLLPGKIILPSLSNKDSFRDKDSSKNTQGDFVLALPGDLVYILLWVRNFLGIYRDFF